MNYVNCIKVFISWFLKVMNINFCEYVYVYIDISFRDNIEIWLNWKCWFELIFFFVLELIWWFWSYVFVVYGKLVREFNVYKWL